MSNGEWTFMTFSLPVSLIVSNVQDLFPHRNYILLKVWFQDQANKYEIKQTNTVHFLEYFLIHPV